MSARDEAAEKYVEQRIEPRPSSSGTDARDLVALLFAKGESRLAYTAGWDAGREELLKPPTDAEIIRVRDALADRGTFVLKEAVEMFLNNRAALTAEGQER